MFRILLLVGLTPVSCLFVSDTPSKIHDLNDVTDNKHTYTTVSSLPLGTLPMKRHENTSNNGGVEKKRQRRHNEDNHNQVESGKRSLEKVKHRKWKKREEQKEIEENEKHTTGRNDTRPKKLIDDKAHKLTMKQKEELIKYQRDYELFVKKYGSFTHRSMKRDMDSGNHNVHKQAEEENRKKSSKEDTGHRNDGKKHWKKHKRDSGKPHEIESISKNTVRAEKISVLNEIKWNEGHITHGVDVPADEEHHYKHRRRHKKESQDVPKDPDFKRKHGSSESKKNISDENRNQPRKRPNWDEENKNSITDKPHHQEDGSKISREYETEHKELKFAHFKNKKIDETSREDKKKKNDNRDKSKEKDDRKDKDNKIDKTQSVKYHSYEENNKKESTSGEYTTYHKAFPEPLDKHLVHQDEDNEHKKESIKEQGKEKNRYDKQEIFSDPQKHQSLESWNDETDNRVPYTDKEDKKTKSSKEVSKHSNKESWKGDQEKVADHNEFKSSIENRRQGKSREDEFTEHAEEIIDRDKNLSEDSKFKDKKYHSDNKNYKTNRHGIDKISESSEININKDDQKKDFDEETTTIRTEVDDQPYSTTESEMRHSKRNDEDNENHSSEENHKSTKNPEKSNSKQTKLDEDADNANDDNDIEEHERPRRNDYRENFNSARYDPQLNSPDPYNRQAQNEYSRLSQNDYDRPPNGRPEDGFNRNPVDYNRPPDDFNPQNEYNKPSYGRSPDSYNMQLNQYDRPGNNYDRPPDDVGPGYDYNHPPDEYNNRPNPSEYNRMQAELNRISEYPGNNRKPPNEYDNNERNDDDYTRLPNYLKEDLRRSYDNYNPRDDSREHQQYINDFDHDHDHDYNGHHDDSSGGDQQGKTMPQILEDDRPPPPASKGFHLFHNNFLGRIRRRIGAKIRKFLGKL